MTLTWLIGCLRSNPTLSFDGMRFPPADLNTPVSNEPAPPPRSIPAGATPTHQPHAAAGSPGCAQVSPDIHRRCTAPVRSPAAPGRWPPARRTHSPLRGGRSWPARRGSRSALLRRQAAVALARIAAEAERLQVADGVGAALVFGDDVVHLQGPLVLDLLSNSHAPQHSQRPWAHR